MVLGSGIRGPGSGKNPFRIPDPGVKKAPDPGSGSATLPVNQANKIICKFKVYLHNETAARHLKHKNFSGNMYVIKEELDLFEEKFAKFLQIFVSDTDPDPQHCSKAFAADD